MTETGKHGRLPPPGPSIRDAFPEFEQRILASLDPTFDTYMTIRGYCFDWDPQTGTHGYVDIESGGADGCLDDCEVAEFREEFDKLGRVQGSV